MATVSFDYSKNDSGVTIEKYCGSESVVDVPYSIGNKSVTKIGDGAFANCTEIKRINIPYCVTEISIDAFAGCTNLTEIYWNNTLFKLGGDSVKRFGRGEICVPKFFAVRDEAKKIPAPPVLLKTPVEDFYYSRDGLGIVIEKYFGSNSVVVVPPKIDGAPVVYIGFDAFGGNLQLKELHLPDGLLSINSRALDGCRNLKNFYVPRTLLEGDAADAVKKIVDALPEGCKIHYT